MRQLLVIADKKGTQQAAFYHALEIAENTGASIEFVGFVHAPGVDSSELLSQEEKRKVRHSYIDKKQKEIELFLSGVDIEKGKVKTDVVWEKALDKWVKARCEQRSFELVFKSGNRSESFLYTPTDWQLIRNCPNPVVIVGDKPWRKGGIILAALDLSSKNENSLRLNEDILKQSIELAKVTKSEVHACYSMSIPRALADLDLIDPVAYKSKIKSNLDPVIKSLFDSVGLSQDNLHLLSGKPAKEICRISHKIGADLVVIGNKTKASLAGRLLGNTAENVLHKIKADVLVIK
jgi:universal stress protein E